MNSLFDLVFGDGNPFSFTLSLIGILNILLLAAVVLSVLRKRKIVEESAAEEERVDPDSVGFTGVAYFFIGVLILDLMQGLIGYWFLHGSFPFISFCVSIVALALCILGQIAGWLEPFAYKKVLFSFDAVAGLCAGLGLLVLTTRLGIDGLLSRVLYCVVYGLLFFLVYLFNKKIAERTITNRHRTIISKIKKSLKYYQSGGKDHRHPLRVVLSLGSFCLTFSALWLIAAYSLPIYITSGQSMINQEDGSKVELNYISNLALCPIAYVYYQEGDTNPFAINSYYYQTLGSDIVLYRWNESSSNVSVDKFNWTNEGYPVEHYRDNGTIRYIEEFDKSGEKNRQVDYDKNNKPKYYWKYFRDENGEEQYTRITPEGVEIT